MLASIDAEQEPNAGPGPEPEPELLRHFPGAGVEAETWVLHRMLIQNRCRANFSRQQGHEAGYAGTRAFFPGLGLEFELLGYFTWS